MIWIEDAIEDGLDLGNRAFGIRVTPKLDAATEIEHPSRYDFSDDTLTVFNLTLDRFKTNGLDAAEIARVSVTHECGHAKEARIFAQSGVFPFRFNLGRGYIKIDGHVADVSQLKPHLMAIMNSFLEFSVDDILLERFRLRDEIAIQRLKKLQQTKVPPSGADYLAKKLETLANMPLDVNYYFHGKLQPAERELLRDVDRRLVGQRAWLTAVNLLRNRAFGDVPKWKRVVSSYLGEVLRWSLPKVGPVRRSESGRTFRFKLPPHE